LWQKQGKAYLKSSKRSIEIEVDFFAYLVNYSPTGEKRATLFLEEGATLKELLDRLGIPEKLEMICLVNRTYYSKEKTLQQGDVVSIFPMIDGG
jgi:molybdopterin converting factor small subunit